MGSGRGWLAIDWPSTGAFSTLLRRPGLRVSSDGVLATKSERKMLASTCLYSLYAWLVAFVTCSAVLPASSLVNMSACAVNGQETSVRVPRVSFCFLVTCTSLSNSLQTFRFLFHFTFNFITVLLIFFRGRLRLLGLEFSIRVSVTV